MSDTNSCVDRTNKYLLSLQTAYRESSIDSLKLVPAQQSEIVPSNPFRMMLSFTINATASVDVYFITGDGVLVKYATFAVPTNITVTFQQQYMLPTFRWIAIATNPDSVNGVSFVKT